MRSKVDDFLASPVGDHLNSIASTLTENATSHHQMSSLVSSLTPTLSESQPDGKGFEPDRVSTAISAQFLNQVTGSLSQFTHLQTICTELYSFIYKDFSGSSDESNNPDMDDSGNHDLRSFMHGMPFFELARSLRVHVTRLEEERKELEAEEAQLVVRRQVRKRVVRRLITERQRQLMHVFFGQWRTTVEKIHEKVSSDA